MLWIDGDRKNICGENIKKYREHRSLSLEQCCEELRQEGLTLSAIELNQIELGEQVVFDREVLYFCKVLSITVEQMFEDVIKHINTK